MTKVIIKDDLGLYQEQGSGFECHTSSSFYKDIILSSSLHIKSSVFNNIKTVSESSYTVTKSDYIILLDTSSNSITASLLSIESSKKGTELIFKDIDSASVNGIKLLPSGSDLIDKGVSLAISVDLESVKLVSDGISNWYII